MLFFFFCAAVPLDYMEVSSSATDQLCDLQASVSHSGSQDKTRLFQGLVQSQQPEFLRVTQLCRSCLNDHKRMKLCQISYIITPN